MLLFMKADSRAFKESEYSYSCAFKRRRKERTSEIMLVAVLRETQIST